MFRPYSKANLVISIHALLAEGDSRWGCKWCSETIFQSTPSSRRATGTGIPPGRPRPISIHALLAEGDAALSRQVTSNYTFQSTPSSRRATTWDRGSTPRLQFQSTPSSRRATGDCGYGNTGRIFKISIHALLAEGDFTILDTFRPLFNFNPRPPRGGRLISFMRQGLFP